MKDICLGDCCFICGATPTEKEFNNEHVLPRWLLRRYDLFAKTITLPNKEKVRYDSYTVPCCSDCNSFLGTHIETPVSEIVQSGAEAIHDFILNGGLLIIFSWMALIFLKTHLKDRHFRFHLDARKGDDLIADLYEWEPLHHIHCLVRAPYVGCCEMDKGAVGSVLALPVRSQASADRFDFGDLYIAQTMMIRLGDTAILTVFNDSGGAMNYFFQKLEKITGPVSELQLREIMVELAYLNLHLKERPQFYTSCDGLSETCRIVGTRPQLELTDMDASVRGELMLFALGHALPHLRVAGLKYEEVVSTVQAGRFTFLFDDDGMFIKDSWTPT
nr:HNH endonuclease [Bradyrhizobium sp. 2S1]MCK7667585.1 HNH endonuclease [Bradyrhizobium sp. 2S1]